MGRVNIGSAFAGLTGASDKPQDRIVMLSPAELTPWRNPYTGEAQPFQVDESKLSDLEESVKSHGIINPILARRLDDRIEIVAGERRWRVANRLEMTSVPVVIRAMSDEEAAILLVDTNLTARDEILPSEKAAAYKLRLDALKRQGRRTDLEEGDTHNSYNVIASEVGDSARQIQRYVRLNYLVPELQSAVDEGKLPMTAAVELSYVPQEKQREVVERVNAGESIKVADAKEQRVESTQTNQEMTIAEMYVGLPDDTRIRKRIARAFFDDLGSNAGYALYPDRFDKLIERRCKSYHGNSCRQYRLNYSPKCILVKLDDSDTKYRVYRNNIRSLLMEFPDANFNLTQAMANVQKMLSGLGKNAPASPCVQLAIKLITQETEQLRDRNDYKMRVEAQVNDMVDPHAEGKSEKERN